ncbi:MAG: hypothetical protein HQK54_10775 [Oligoflexales bacterium]|nr:hypothetical protein [Oligoflexales bacterium]
MKNLYILFALIYLTACGGSKNNDESSDNSNPIVKAACKDIKQGGTGTSLLACIEYSMPKSSVDSMKASCSAANVNGTWVDDATCATTGIVGTCSTIAGGQEVNKMKIFFYPAWTAAQGESVCTSQYKGTWTLGS